MVIQGAVSAFCRTPDESASSTGDGERFGAYELNVGQRGLLTARLKLRGFIESMGCIRRVWVICRVVHDVQNGVSKKWRAYEPKM